MNRKIIEIIEEIRKDSGWAEDEVIIFLNTTKERLPDLVKALKDIGLTETQGAALVTDKQGRNWIYN